MPAVLGTHGQKAAIFKFDHSRKAPLQLTEQNMLCPTGVLPKRQDRSAVSALSAVMNNDCASTRNAYSKGH